MRVECRQAMQPARWRPMRYAHFLSESFLCCCHWQVNPITTSRARPPLGTPWTQTQWHPSHLHCCHRHLWMPRTQRVKPNLSPNTLNQPPHLELKPTPISFPALSPAFRSLWLCRADPDHHSVACHSHTFLSSYHVRPSHSCPRPDPSSRWSQTPSIAEDNDLDLSTTPPSLTWLPPSAPLLLRGIWAQLPTLMLADDDDSDHHHYPAHDNDQQRGQ